MELIDLVTYLKWPYSDGFNFPTWIPDLNSHSPAFLFLLMLLFALQWLSLHWEILIVLLSQFPLTFCQTQNRMPCFTLWLFLCWLGSSSKSFERCSWDYIFKFSASPAASEFCEWVQAGIDVYIPHRKYLVKPHSSPWFLSGTPTSICHFFCPSVCQSIAHHISGTIHHLIISFGTRI